MKKELDEQLCAKYPAIFADRHADMTVTCMCWGFDCGDGWFNIIDQLCLNIQHHIDSNRKNIAWTKQHNEKKENAKNQHPIPDEIPQVVATQVKEKFGTLCFYYGGGDDIIDGMVRMAEAMSGVTCEKCGVPGKRNDAGWIRTLCEAHTESL